MSFRVVYPDEDDIDDALEDTAHNGQHDPMGWPLCVHSVTDSFLTVDEDEEDESSSEDEDTEEAQEKHMFDLARRQVRTQKAQPR